MPTIAGYAVVVDSSRDARRSTSRGMKSLILLSENRFRVSLITAATRVDETSEYLAER